MQLWDLTKLVGSPNAVSPIAIGELALRFLHDLREGGKAETIRLVREFWPLILHMFLVGVLLLWTAWSFFLRNHSVNWRLTFWISATSSLITILPIATKFFFPRSRWGVLVEVAVLAMSLILFTRIFLQLPFESRWTLSTIVLIFLLSAGGRSIELLHGSIRERLAREWEQAPGSSETDQARKGLVHTHLGSFQKYFSSELLVYSALPVGTLLGLFLCWALRVDFRDSRTVVAITLCSVFGLAGLIMLWFLGVSFLCMVSPLLRLPDLAPSDLNNREQSALDWGSILTDYRKMFFYDAVLNTALVLVFGVFEWFLSTHRGLSVDDPKLAGIALVGLIVLNEAPYLFGQKRMQELLTSPYKGWEKNLKDKEVGETIPLVPKFEFFAALVGEASIGGIALEVMKQITELVEKHP